MMVNVDSDSVRAEDPGQRRPIIPPPELFAKCYEKLAALEEAERNLQVSFSREFIMSHMICTAYDAGHTAGANQEPEAP